LLRALLLQMLHSVRSERLLIEEIDYNILFRWFVGLNLDDAVWDATVFTKNRDRLLEAEVGGWPRLNSEKRLGAVSLRFSSGAEDTAGGAGGLGREEQEGGAAERADGVGGGRNSGEFFLEGRVFGSAQ